MDGVGKVWIINGSPKYESLWKYSQDNACEIIQAYWGSWSRIFSFIRIMWMKYKLPFESFWYKRLRKQLENDKPELIVILEPGISRKYLEFLSAILSNTSKKVYYYWNIISSKNLSPEIIRELGFEPWSFDENDCKHYGVRYNPQFYFPSWYENLEKVSATSDISFVGRDKNGRMQEIDGVLSDLRNYGVTVNTYFTAEKWYKRWNSKRYGRYLDLRDMINEEKKGRVILDYSVNGQSGPTLRLYDGLCTERKVLTNNISVRHLDLYDSRNVFIMGVDSYENLAEFCRTPFENKALKYLDKYSVGKWLERF